MKTLTIENVNVDPSGAGTFSITGTYADQSFTQPAQQTTVGDFPSANPNWSRAMRITDQAVFCIRNGADTLALLMTSFAKVAYTFIRELTWPPLITAEPVAASTVFAKGVLTATTPNDGDTVTIGVDAGAKTYTFKTELGTTEGNVLIEGSAANALINLKAAIDHTGTAYPSNTKYYCAAAHTQVKGGTLTVTTLQVVSLIVGTSSNSYATTENTTASRLAWSATTLLGGTAAATFTVVAVSEVQSGQTYRWQCEDATTYAAGILTSDTVIPEDGDTITIGNKTYTLKTALTASTTANEVLIAGTAAAALDNLKHAIDGSGTPGTDYGSETIAHTQVDGSTLTSTALTVVAIVADTAANAYVTTVDSLHLSWADPTLVNGGWVSATGTINGCVYSNDTTFTMTCTPTTTGQSGVGHRCVVRNGTYPAGMKTDSAEVDLTIT